MTANDTATRAILSQLSSEGSLGEVAFRVLDILATSDRLKVAPAEAAPDDPVRFLAIAARACFEDRGSAMTMAVGEFVDAAQALQKSPSTSTLLVLYRDAYEVVRRAVLAAIDINKGKAPSRAERRRAQRG